MLMLSLLCHLSESLIENRSNYTQVWYADDSSATGKFSEIRGWLEQLMNIDQYYGYFPEPNKSCLVAKEAMIPLARSLFQDLGVHIVTSCRFLGGVIGDAVGKNEFIFHKVKEWSQYVEALSKLAVNQPQAAYVALSKSLQHEWAFLQLITPHCSTFLSMLNTRCHPLFTIINRP